MLDTELIDRVAHLSTKVGESLFIRIEKESAKMHFDKSVLSADDCEQFLVMQT